LHTKELIAELNPLCGDGANITNEPRPKALQSTRPMDRAADLVASIKRWRNGGWTQLRKATLYGEYELVNLVGLIPSLASRSVASS